MSGPVVDWPRIRAVVFDVDGTLYAQRPMRLRMARELALRCLARPATVAEVRILRTFRQVREELADREVAGIGRRQYEAAAERLGLPPARVERVVAEWMLERPLRHVAACRYPGTRRLFAALRDSGRRLGVWSDYPAIAKLEALGLAADAVVSAVDPEVGRMKPQPAGLARALELLAVEPAEALMVGDRDERDGETARRLGCPWVLLRPRPSGANEIGSLQELLAGLEQAERGSPPA